MQLLVNCLSPLTAEATVGRVSLAGAVGGLHPATKEGHSTTLHPCAKHK